MAALIDTATGNVRYVSVGHYPYGAGITSDGRYGLVSSETQGTVSVIDLAAGKVVKDLQVAPPLSHPESIAVDPKAPLAFVGNANQDTISVIDTKSFSVARTLSVERPQGVGTSPTYVSVTPDGCDLLSADSGEDAVAVFALSKKKRCGEAGKPPGKKKGKKKGKKGRESTAQLAAKHKGKGKKKSGGRKAKKFQLVGRIPTGSYPTVAAATPKRHQLVWVSARGLGVGPNPNGPNPDTGDDTYLDQYLPSIVYGASGVLTYPSDRKIRKLTPISDRQVVPADARTAPSDTPIRAGGPIKHVFYIVRENRTYDQMLGDDSRGDGDPSSDAIRGLDHSEPPCARAALPTARPCLRELGGIDRRPLLDGRRSGLRLRGQELAPELRRSQPALRLRLLRGQCPAQGLHLPANAGVRRFLLQLRRGAGRSLALPGQGPDPGADRPERAAAQRDRHRRPAQRRLLRQRHLDLRNARDRPEGGQRLRLEPAAGFPARRRLQVQLLQHQVPGPAGRQLGSNLQLSLAAARPHRGPFPRQAHPDADIADNDWGLGQIVDTISHSSIWNSSLILVVEDDSQNGADHVDAHRIPALVISPYTQQGSVVHDRYDQLSFLRTLEVISGLPSLNLGEALAVPLYNAVTPNVGNSAPYNAIMPSVNMTAVNPADRTEHCGLEGPAAQRDRSGPPARARRDAVALPARLQVEAPAAGAERLHTGQQGGRRRSDRQ